MPGDQSNICVTSRFPKGVAAADRLYLNMEEVMKKAIVIMLTGAMMLAAVACGGSSSNSTPAQNNTQTEEAKPAEETQETVESTVEEPEQTEVNVPEDAMSFEDYMAAATDAEVVVQGAIQGKQGFFSRDDQGLATVYLQDEKGGAYFIYELPCTEKEYELMEIGKIIKVKGYMSEWSGEIEVVDVETWMFVDGEYIAEAEDVTALLGTDELASKMNKKVAFKGMTVEPIKNKDDEDVAFIYNYDGSGERGPDTDLYFNVSVNGQTYTFTVESYLCGPDSDVYKAVEDLKIGDVIDMEGFLYWYNGPNPHITAIVAQ